MERILLLEDDKSLVTGLALALGRAGYALDTARTLAEANRLWQAGRYDLLMLDVTLPDGTGFDFCRKVRIRLQRFQRGMHGTWIGGEVHQCP
jgi:DNA-binding response OmpR family regulator